MDSSLGLNIFTLLFLTGTFLAALVAGLGGFAFGIVAAAVWLYILSPLQTAILIMGLGLVVQVFSLEIAACIALAKADADPRRNRTANCLAATVKLTGDCQAY